MSKFTGKERDAESGLDNFGARYDASSLGRFMTPDEFWKDSHVGDPQSWNEYAYARNNPLRYVDPTGENAQVSGSCDQEKKTCQINVQASISIYAESGSNLNSDQLKAAASQIKSTVEAAWSGSFEQGGFQVTVSTSVTVSVASSEKDAVASGAGNVIAIKNGDAIPGKASSVVYPNLLGIGPDRGVWNYNNIMHPMPLRNEAGHEFGHLLGVDDREQEGLNALMNHKSTGVLDATQSDFRWAFGPFVSGTARNVAPMGAHFAPMMGPQSQERTLTTPRLFQWWR